MGGLVPAIHAALPQRRDRYWRVLARIGAYWRGALQKLADARFFASAGCLPALDSPNHVDGRDKPGHDDKGSKGQSAKT